MARQVRRAILKRLDDKVARDIAERFFVKGRIFISKKDYLNKIRELSESELQGQPIQMSLFQTPANPLDKFFAQLEQEIKRAEDRKNDNYDIFLDPKLTNDELIVVEYSSKPVKSGGQGKRVQVLVRQTLKRAIRKAAAKTSNKVIGRLVDEHQKFDPGVGGEADFPTNRPYYKSKFFDRIFGRKKREQIVRNQNIPAAERATKKGAEGSQGSIVEQKIRYAVSEAFKELSGDNHLFKEDFVLISNWVNQYFGYDAELNQDFDPESFLGQLKISSRLTPETFLNTGTMDAAIRNNFTKILSPLSMAKLYLKHMKKFSLKELFQIISNSPSPEKKFRALASKNIIQQMFPHETNPDMRLKVNKQLVAEKRVKRKDTDRVTRTVKDNITKIAGTKVAQKAAGRKAKRRNQQKRIRESSPTSLLNILNAILPAQVAKNMTAPALRYRTGRFANSARLTSINSGPRGGTNVEYTYMRDPYETFEPGNKQGSTLRDPRRLIGGTIRQIMAQQAITKFNLKRV